MNINFVFAVGAMTLFTLSFWRWGEYSEVTSHSHGKLFWIHRIVCSVQMYVEEFSMQFSLKNVQCSLKYVVCSVKNLVCSSV